MSLLGANPKGSFPLLSPEIVEGGGQADSGLLCLLSTNIKIL